MSSKLLTVVALATVGCQSPTEPKSVTTEPTEALLPSFETAPLTGAMPVTSFAARQADEFLQTIGVNVHMSYLQSPYGKSWSSVVKPKIVALGIRHVRDLAIVHPDDGWMRLVYGRMKELAPYKIKFTLMMRPAEGSNNYTSLSHWNRLMQYALPVVESFEGINEHDLTKRANWPAEVRSFQQALWNTAKNDPRTRHMPIFAPSMGNPGNAHQVGDLTRYMNYGNIHPYPGGKTPLANYADHMKKVAPISGNRRVVATESGYHNTLAWTGGHPPVSERAMGHYTLRLLFDHFNIGIPRTWLYEMIDQGTNPTRREDHFGLLRADGSEKPAYTAIKNLSSVLKDPGTSFVPGALSFGLSGDVVGIKSMVLQKRDGRFYVVLWHDANCFDLTTKRDLQAAGKHVLLNLTKSSAIRVFTPGSTASVVQQAQSASIAVTVGDHPMVIEVRQ